MRWWLGCCLAVAGCHNDGSLSVSSVALDAPSTLKLGQAYVGGAATRELGITNTGTSTLTSIAVSTPPQVSAVLESARLTPGQRTRAWVRWMPEVAGAFTAELTITSSAAPHVVTLVGEALAQSPCDDDNDCTTDVFDPTSGSCSHQVHTGSCDDGDACTTGDLCVGDVCMGVAVSCDDGDSCTQDGCDPTLGCVYVPDPTTCDDGNPCTVDTCQDNACQSTPLADFSLCPGQRLSCQGWPVCLASTCEILPTPNGTPCDDGSVCSTGDTCQAGSCVGVDATTPPELLGTAFSFGVDDSYGSEVAVLSNERLVFLSYSSNDTVLASVRVTPSGLVLEDTLPLSGRSAYGLDITRRDEHSVLIYDPFVFNSWPPSSPCPMGPASCSAPRLQSSHGSS